MTDASLKDSTESTPRDAHGQKDPTLQEFRDLIKPPTSFEEGFTWAGMIGTLFIALIMVPGAIYMQLVSGFNASGAARWVMPLLFLEIARRTHKSLKRAEIFVLFYVTGAILASPALLDNPLFIQYFVRSKAVISQGWAGKIPAWFAPSDPTVLGRQSFFSWPWLAPIGMIVLRALITRLNGRVLGYGLFKITSDYEKLPFPLAPVDAQGVMALAEEDHEGSWRWKVFSIGGAIGLVFGALYLGVPILSNAFFGISMQPFPIPWVEWTNGTGSFLSAVPTGLSFDMTFFVLGMVMPFSAVCGSVIGLLATYVANPILYYHGILRQWRQGDDTVKTIFKNNIDFYFSLTIGLSLAVATIGIGSIVKLFAGSWKRSTNRSGTAPPAGRGDVANWAIIAIYCASSLTYILVSGYLIGWHRGVMCVMIVYAFVLTPLISYVSARVEGIAGQVFSIPLAKESLFILSGFKGLAVWFLPIPDSNYGGKDVVQYRQAELTGTRFRSLWKADLIFVPLVIASTVIFSNFVWSLAPVPSPAYPFANRIWELSALNSSVVFSATMGDFSEFSKAFNVTYLLIGLGIGLALALSFSRMGISALFFYGIIAGLNQSSPHTIFLMFFGALLGQFYFQRRFGEKWRQYIPVIAAGFTCGMGLIAMLCIGVTFLSKAAFQQNY